MKKHPTKARLLHSGFNTLRLANAFLSVEIVPDLGARIVSLKNPRTGREWCWHPEAEARLHGNSYGDAFSDSPHVGFDECFPTIAPSDLNGRRLPCHGEVWSEPWFLDEEAWEKGVISTTISCRQSPFELNRRVSVHGNQLDLHYVLKNLGNASEPYLWAFHPMIRVHAEDRLELPREVAHLRIEGAKGSPADAEGSQWSWPAPFPGFQLDRFDLGANQCASVKGFTRKLNSPWARIANRTSGEFLEMSWDAAKNPFLGVWINRGGYKGFQNVAALEPSNARTDSLGQHHPHLPAGATCSWSMSIALGERQKKSTPWQHLINP